MELNRIDPKGQGQGGELSEFARHIVKAALAAVEPEKLIKKAIRREGSRIEIKETPRQEIIDLERYRRVFIVAMGKAAPFMAESFLYLLGDKVYEGIVVCLPQVDFSWPRIRRLEAPHPHPDERSVAAAENIIKLSQRIQPEDLVFFLISGGASAQLVKPINPISLEEKVEIIKALMEAGADIKELNVVRKHLSQVKGGKLGRYFRSATVVNLIISDVINDDIETIASAPTAWDSSTFLDAKKIIRRYGLWARCPESIKEVINKGIRGEIEETRKKEEIDPSKTLNFIIGNIETALRAAASMAKAKGYYPIIISQRERGEAREVARVWSALVRSIISKEKLRSPALALLSGGELTVRVKGKGRGGRNMEFCLALLKELKDRPITEGIAWSCVSLATDGRDGPTEAAGATISPAIVTWGEKKGLEIEQYLDNNDSFSFFEKVGSLIITGNTKTNVMDLRLFLIKKNE